MFNGYLSETRFMGILMARFILISLFLFSGCGDEFEDAPPEVARKLKPQVKGEGNTSTDTTDTTGTTAEKINEICDADDKKIFYKNSSFSDSWGRVARKSWGNARETTDRLRTIYSGESGLSKDCGNCFGAVAACGASNCKAACWWDQTSTKCEQCGWTYCGVEWERCTGHPRSDLSRYYYP